MRTKEVLTTLLNCNLGAPTPVLTLQNLPHDFFSQVESRVATQQAGGIICSLRTCL